MDDMTATYTISVRTAGISRSVLKQLPTVFSIPPTEWEYATPICWIAGNVFHKDDRRKHILVKLRSDDLVLLALHTSVGPSFAPGTTTIAHRGKEIPFAAVP